MWTGGLALSVSGLEPIRFFVWRCVKSRVYHGGKPEARRPIVEAMDEAGFNIGK
jgi:hypothetical protein